MDVNFSGINMDDRQVLILKRPDGTPVGVLGNAIDITFEPHYNEISTLAFRLPKAVDGEPTPFYDDTVGLMLVELKDIGQFVIKSPEDKGNKIQTEKSVSAQSLECEFSRKKITLPESTYKFFDSTNPDGTVLAMIMEQMPTWSIGSVASAIKDKYRTFDVSNENLYNFIKGTVQEAFNCIFEFDTLNRVVNVRDADAEPSQKQVFISRDNLAKDIVVKEETDDIVTRLDVSGADGVDIRDVNPTGTNQIINLDYFMNGGFFSAALVSKYNAWKTLISNNTLPFYNYSVQYALRVSEEIAEQAKLADLQGEYTSLENIQAVIIQGIASKIKTQADLDQANRNLAAKKAEITAKESAISAITTEKNRLLGYMSDIRNACAFDKYFTKAECKTMDPYLIDNEIQDSTFVASDVQSYSDGEGNSIANKTVSITGATVSAVTSASGSTIKSITGGTLTIGGIVSARCVSAIIERRTDGKVIMSIYAGQGTYNSGSFPSACISIAGQGSVSSTDTSVTSTVTSGTLYFSLNATDYEKKSVAWDLYEYGESLLNKMAYPSYTFTVDSANFIALDAFLLFKNELELGQRVYIEVRDGKILQPICTGAKIYFGDKPKLDLMFTDTYTAGDSQSKLIDLLDKSVSMGKTLSAGKFTYESWTNSGADTDLKNFINSALDTAKNAIMSSTEQAVSWDGAGLRLRKYKNAGHTAYDGEQIWMSNNSIMMTDDGWATAKMAIGKFVDDNVGEQWGIIAPMVVGTLLAGEELVIESEKKSGSQAGQRTMFRVDADGARLYNADFELQKTTGSTTTQILLDPSVGVAMGTYPLKKSDGTLNKDNAKFYVDTDGTMTLAGTIYSYKGVIGGWTISDDGLYSGSTDATSVGMTSSGDIRIWAGKKSSDKANAPFYVKQDGTMKATKGTVGGWYLGTDYIGNQNTKANSTVGMASGTGTNVVFWAGNAQASAPFRVQADGTIIATKGQVGGWYIGSDYIGNQNTKANSTVGMASGTGTSIIFWAGGAQASAPFRVQADGKVYASNLEIVGGSIKIGDKFSVSSDGKVSATDLSITGGSITLGDNFSVSSDGTLTAKAGTVGGWYIGSDYIGNKSKKECSWNGQGYDDDGSTIGIAKGTGNDVIFWAGGTRNDLTAYGKTRAPFRVEADGDLYCSNGTFGGTVYATQVSTAKGALVSGQIGSSEIKEININASAVTNSKLGSGAVSEGKIGANAVSYGKTASGVQGSLDSADASALLLSGKTTCSLTVCTEVDFENQKAYGYKINWIGTINL